MTRFLVAGLLTFGLASCATTKPPSSATAPSSAAVAAPAADAKPAAAAPGVELISAEFGLFNVNDIGEAYLSPANVVPLKEGQAYGWIILVKTDKPKIKWRKEFTLPVAPDRWGGSGEGDFSVSSDRRVAVTEREEALQDGMIANVRSVAPGDPTGHHVIRVLIEGTLEQVFEFDVK